MAFTFGKEEAVVRTEFRYGQKIQNLREQRAWTQEHLAGSADLDVRTIQRVEKDKTQNPETLQAIAGAFDVDLAALRKTLLVPESRLLRVELLTTYAQFVRSEESHRHQAFVRAILVSSQDTARIGDLWEQVFEDRESLNRTSILFG